MKQYIHAVWHTLRIHKKLCREIVVLALVCFLLFTIGAVYTYHPHGAISHGPCGVWGSLIAGALVWLFGGVALYVLVLCLGAVACFFLPLNRDVYRWPLISAVLCIPLLCLAAYISHVDWHASYQGGIIGSFLGEPLHRAVGWHGTVLLLFVLFWVSIALSCRRSLVRLMISGLHHGCESLFNYAYYCFVRIVGIGVSTFALVERVYQRGHTLFQGISSFVLGVAAQMKRIAPGYRNEHMQSFPEWSGMSAKMPRSWWERMHSRFSRLTITNTVRVYREVWLLRNTIGITNMFRSESVRDFLISVSSADKRRAATKEATPFFVAVEPHAYSYSLPDLGLFVSDAPLHSSYSAQQREGELRARVLEEKLHHFGVRGSVRAVRPGPVITLFEYEPEIDTKISKILALEDDLALALKALSIRILAPIPGKSVVGFEIANELRDTVHMSGIVQSSQFIDNPHTLPLIFGVDSVGQPVVENLVDMPHLLVAGSTGAGKSVGLNVMLCSLLSRCTPHQMRLILIDPKRLEFAPYNDIPHLLFPIVTDPRKASPILQWLVREMEERYEKMAMLGVRSLYDYQLRHAQLVDKGDFEALPYIVLVIDELADLMMVAGKEVEHHIARLAQMARAAGIHMVLATQRPSVDVITGLIKVNLPSRIAYRVSSKIDSKTILDGSGAEKLLGKGDMLFMHARFAGLQRVHSAFVTSAHIQKLTDYWRAASPPCYRDLQEELAKLEGDEAEDHDKDALFDEIYAFVCTQDMISISLLQRKYRIGYNRSARIIDQLEAEGLLAPAQGGKPRRVLSKMS